MQVLTPRPVSRSPRTAAPAVASLLVGVGLLASGFALGYLALTTSIVDRFMQSYRPDVSQTAMAVVGWTVALVAPACFMLLGVARVAESADRLVRNHERRPSVSSLRGVLTDAYAGASNVRLPDGYRIPELVIGPHGVTVFEPLPPAAITRHSAGRWEVRTTSGRWLPLENPLERAARDAERVRRWIGAMDADYVVKVHAAVIAPDASLPRTPTCAVVTRDDIPAFLSSLPPQRSLTETRRQRLIELVESAGR